MKNSFIAALGVALVASFGSVSTSQAFTSVVDQYLTTSLSYTSANFDTSFNLGTTSLSVSGFNSDDRSGLALGDTVTISNGNIPYAIGTPLTVSWTGSKGLFTETLTLDHVFTTTDFGPYYTGAGLVFDGTLTGGGYNNIVASFVLEAEFLPNGGSLVPGGIFLYNAAVDPNGVTAVPEASTWVMMLAGFAALGFARYRRKAMVAA